MTDAETKFEANDQLVSSGYPGKSAPNIILVDRQQGGVERMIKEGFERVIVAYNLLDLTYAFGELNLWPKNTVKIVEAEIEAHQFE